MKSLSFIIEFFFFLHDLLNCVVRQTRFLEIICWTQCSQNNFTIARLMSWKAHLPNFANWASSTIAKLSQVFTTSSQIRRPRKWKLSERGTLECVENICDLIISPCQSVSCNASRGAWVTQFAYFPLNSHKLWHHFHSLTSLKSSSMSTRCQKKTLFLWWNVTNL